MVVAVALTLVDEFAAVPRQKEDGLLGFHIFGMLLFVEDAVYGLSGFCVVLAENGVVLVAVQL
jgi:hypothetical protein